MSVRFLLMRLFFMLVSSVLLKLYSLSNFFFSFFGFSVNSFHTSYSPAVMGLDSLYNAGKVVALYTNLPQPWRYTGVTWRRSGATIMADNGVTALQLSNRLVIFCFLLFFIVIEIFLVLIVCT